MLTASITTEGIAAVGATEAFRRRACTGAYILLAPGDREQHSEVLLNEHILCDDPQSCVCKAPTGPYLALQSHGADLCVQ